VEDRASVRAMAQAAGLRAKAGVQAIRGRRDMVPIRQPVAESHPAQVQAVPEMLRAVARLYRVFQSAEEPQS
jgi:hypothetical protein